MRCTPFLRSRGRQGLGIACRRVVLMSHDTGKTFTVEEVNRHIPSLERRLARLQRTLTRLEAEAPRKGPDPRLAGLEGGRLVPPAYFRGVQEVLRESRVFEKEGMILRDIRRGLVDFPSVRKGRRVFLCWIKGEERVSYFHELNGGFAGRKPLSP